MIQRCRNKNADRVFFSIDSKISAQRVFFRFNVHDRAEEKDYVTRIFYCANRAGDKQAMI